jgi:hypothetical protein
LSGRSPPKLWGRRERGRGRERERDEIAVLDLTSETHIFLPKKAFAARGKKSPSKPANQRRESPRSGQSNAEPSWHPRRVGVASRTSFVGGKLPSWALNVPFLPNRILKAAAKPKNFTVYDTNVRFTILRVQV